MNKGGKVTQDLMWAGEPREPTHTVDELLELAGMKTKADLKPFDLKPFDLEKALAGEPVVLRDGSKAYIRHYETELDTSDPLVGYRVRRGTVDQFQWTEGGHYYWDEESDYDIVGMWVEPLVFDHWHLLHGDIKFVAKDEDGRWFGYKIKPFIGKFNRWDVSDLDCYLLSSLNPTLFPDCDWENSLIERPENE